MKLITHNDLDGAGCAVIARLHDPVVEVAHCGYDTVDAATVDALNSGDDNVILADIAPTENFQADLWPRIRVFDHHKNNHFGREWLAGRRLCDGAFDVDKCGTRLLAGYLLRTEWYRMEVQAFMDAVEAWDLWKLEHPARAAGADLAALLAFEGMARFVMTRAKKLCPTAAENWLLPILRERDEGYIRSRMATARVVADDDGHKHGVVVASRCTSELGSACAALPGADYGMVLNHERGTVELRSVGDFNVGALARLHGGGGHDRAAGYPMGARE